LAELHVALQDGFEVDEVIVLINGEEAYHKDKVQTRYQISRADEFVVDVTGDAADVIVTLPRRGVSEEFHLATTHPVWLGVSVTASNQLEGRVAQEPFGYA
jgi:hypothetical protein